MKRNILVLAAATVAMAVPGAAHAGAPEATARRGVADCVNADLKASYVATDAATSHRFGRIVLVNVSQLNCEVGGYGGLSYVGGGNGTQIGAAADRDPAVKAHKILLRPGQRVYGNVSAAIAGVYDRTTCRPRHVDGFRVYLPNETKSQFVKHPTTGCANPKVHLLSHQAYERP